MPASPPELELWERQPGESEQAYASFEVYRDQTRPRSIRRVARQVHKSSTIVGRHSSQWKWPARVAAWDRHQTAAQLQATVDERRRAGERHAQIAAGQLVVSARFATEVLKRLAADPDALSRLPLTELLRAQVALMRATPRVAQLERLALGMTSDETEALPDRSDDPSLKSDAELNAFLAGIDAGQLRDATNA